MSNKAGKSEKIDELKLMLDDVRRADYYFLKQRYDRLTGKKTSTDSMEKLTNAIQASIAFKQTRQDNTPRCQFDESLPINLRRDDIHTALLENQVIIVCGETGSGKTTQLPKICLEAGRGIEGVIGHTQPRRLAARTVAKRIADELNSDIGEQVGYKIRHQDHTNKNSYIKLMTDGILLAELQQDRYLNQYDTLIIDEAHERSLNIDFILGYLKNLLPKRPDLKLIITSATIDVDRFSAHFNDAPIIEVSGRSYPVDVLYRPIDQDDESIEREAHILEAIKELSGFDNGDILIFLEGEGEIHETDKFLRKQRLVDTDILPLYSRLSAGRQNKIFASHKRRHIVLATNVAETSLTIPGIRYVIDTGMARLSRYSHRSKVQRLPIEKISQAAANQRKGRCGRTSDGICIRLYNENDFESRTEFTPPEILRTNLAAVILQMKALRIGEIEDFPFIEPPDRKFVNDGLRLLRELNALDKQDRLTAIGRKVVRLPLDPRYARMLLAAVEFNCLQEILIIVSALSIQDPRERPIDNTEKADKAHAQFINEKSDFLWFINLWQFYHQQMKKLSQNKLKKLCQQNFLSFMRMREWLDIHRQLRHVCTELGFNINSEPSSYQNVHCAILAGLPSHVAFLSDKHEYTGARNIKLHLFPASSQFQLKPKWVVAAELVETSRLFARHVAQIDSKWLVNTAAHLLKYEYSDIKWDSKSARVVALESISLYGMTLIAGKKVHYGPIKPEEARAIFIRQGLVMCELESGVEFYKSNKTLIEEIRQQEIKLRRPDVLNEEAIYDFYMQNIPDDVYDLKSFSLWAKQRGKEGAKTFLLTRDMILHHDAEDQVELNYPDTIQSGNIALPIEYSFCPGEVDDGLTIDVSLHQLSQLDEVRMDYLVPGLLTEKIICLLKSLPKQIRKQLVPIPEFAEECNENLTNHTVSLKKNLAAYLYKTRLIRIDMDDWSDSDMPGHLSVNYRVIDPDNHVVATGKDLNLLRQQHAGESEQAFNRLFVDVYSSEEVLSWDFGDLPASQSIENKGEDLTIYPALIEEDGKVYRHAFDRPETANYYHRFGLRTLIKNTLPKDIKYLSKNLRDIEKLALLYSDFGAKQELIKSIVNLVVDETFLDEKPLPRQQDRFLARVEQGKNRLLLNGETICKWLEQTLVLYRKINNEISALNIERHQLTVDDIEDQLAYMMYGGFLNDVSFEYLMHYPRYFEAILKRIAKLEFHSDKDVNNMEIIKEHWQRIKQLLDDAYETDDFNELLYEYRWMMEEMRISLFTQELKTIKPVSIKRLDKLWDTLREAGQV